MFKTHLGFFIQKFFLDSSKVGLINKSSRQKSNKYFYLFNLFLPVRGSLGIILHETIPYRDSKLYVFFTRVLIKVTKIKGLPGRTKIIFKIADLKRLVNWHLLTLVKFVSSSYSNLPNSHLLVLTLNHLPKLTDTH